MFATVIPDTSIFWIITAIVFVLVSIVSSAALAESRNEVIACITITFFVVLIASIIPRAFINYHAAEENIELVNKSGVTVLSDNLGDESPLNDISTFTRVGNAVSVTVQVDGTDTILSCKIVPDNSKTFSVLCEAPEETSSGLIPLDELVSSQ